MAYDLNKIRERLEQLKTGNKGPAEIIENTWKPKKPGDGPSQVRIIPSPFHEDEPFDELHYHYDIGKPGFICPEMTYGKTCPACEMRKQLFEAGGEANKSLAKKFFSRPRYYALVVDREEKDNVKPKYWAFGIGIYKELLGYLIDPDYSHYLDPKEGIDITVEQTKDPKKDFPDTAFKFRRKESPLAKTDKEIQEIISKAVPLTEVFKSLVLDVDKIEERVAKFLSPKEGDIAEEDAEANSAEIAKGGKKSKDSVDDAFESLLNDEDISDDDE